MSRDDDTDALLEVCKSFERLTLKIPVVSVYETKETSTSRSIFSKLRSKERNQAVRIIVIHYVLCFRPIKRREVLLKN